MPRWPWWQGGRKKLPGSRRALQLIQALEPQATVISSDTGDLLIGNSLSAAHKRALRELASNNELLVAAECNSWPLCYREAYAHDAEVRECLGSHGACYPNSGVLTASVATMLRFYERWADTINASAHMRRAERFNDQAAIHRLYQNRSAHQARGDFTLRVDKENLFSLQLWKCDGERMRKKGPFEYCHEKRFEPAKGVRTEDSGRTTLFTDELGVDQRPFLVHSNGYTTPAPKECPRLLLCSCALLTGSRMLCHRYHYVMKRDATGLRPLLDRYTAEPPPSELLSTGVVLVDTFDHGLCNFTTLGWLMNRTRSQGEPALSLRTAEHVPERT